MTLKKLLLVVLVAAVPVAASALPASAHVESFTVDSTVLTRGHNVRAEGTIVCTSGNTAWARLKVDQPTAFSPDGQAKGHFGFDTGQPCSGEIQPWHATLTLRKALPILHHGSAHFSALIRTDSPDCVVASRLPCQRAYGSPEDQFFEATVNLT